MTRPKTWRKSQWAGKMPTEIRALTAWAGRGMLGRPLRALLATLTLSLVIAAAGAAAGQAASVPGVLMGEPQKVHWENGGAECPKAKSNDCSDEVSAGQFVAWPFVAEHTGTVEAIFAVLATGATTGAEVGIYANRRYNYAEIKFNGEPTSSGETWTPAKFQAYEAEIPPEDPGVMLATSGKVPESAIKNEGWTEFKLSTPVKVTKGLKYWLVNTTFQTPSTSETHIYQHFMHEKIATTEEPPWGNYSNEPTTWASVARPLKELPSPETTKINCEKCNTEGWLQEEPRKFKLVNPNREGQEEGGQTYSYAYGKIEEGSGLSGGHPEVLSNGANPVGESRAISAFTYGDLSFRSSLLAGGEVECFQLGLDGLWNSGSPPRTLGRVLSWQEAGHARTSANAEVGSECRGGGGGARVTDEAEIVPVSSKEARHGEPTVPWNLEAICGEREEVPATVIKIGVPTGAAEGAATCRTEEAEALEVKGEIANKQGCYATNPVPKGCVSVAVVAPALGMELDYGGTLRASVVNGLTNGLHQSRWVFEGAASGELQCQAPTGCQATAAMVGELKAQGLEVQLLTER